MASTLNYRFNFGNLYACMNDTMKLVKLAFCGPGDVAKEIALAQGVIDEWNLQHGESSRFWVKHQHWSTDAHPEMGDRPQAIINRQMIDESDVIVAVFWSRFGTSTGVAGSGTEEEIRRGIKLRRKVMVYFSDLEPLPPDADATQVARLWKFRQDLREEGLCWKFSSRNQFEREFRSHLAHVLNEWRRPIHSDRELAAQTIIGNNNNQAGRDLNVFLNPPKLKKVIERREGSVTSAEAKQIQAWIEELAEGETRMERDRAYKKWWARFKHHFALEKYDALLSEDMSLASAWFKQQRAIQTRGLKTKAPDQWRTKRIGAIKAMMREMGVSKEEYYPQIAARLQLKRPFASLTGLTKVNLDRVYTLVRRDAHG